MAIKTFTTETLTSSDVNTYLGNAGLVYITSATIGSAVSSVTVSSCFSSTYDHYRISVTQSGVSVSSQMRMTFGSTSTGYYYGTPLSTMAGGAYAFNSASNVAYIDLGSINSGWKNDFLFDVLSPNLVSVTKLNGFGYMNSATFGGVGNGFVDGTTQYTAFTMTPSAGTLTGGTITVYGYRKA